MKSSNIKKTILTILFCVCLLILVGCGDNTAVTNIPEDYPPEEETPVEKTSFDGEYIAKVCYNSPSKSVLDNDMYIKIANKELEINNRILELEENTFEDSMLNSIIVFSNEKGYDELFDKPLNGLIAKVEETEILYSFYGLLISKDKQIFVFYGGYNKEHFEYNIYTAYILLDINVDRSDIHDPLYILDGKEYGRFVSSSNSREDAIRVATRHFNDTRRQDSTNIVTECEVIYESDILYGLHVVWRHNYSDRSSMYEENVISFKNNIVNMTARNVIYDEEFEYTILTNQFDQIEKIALYIFIDQYYFRGISNYSMMYYEMYERDNYFFGAVYFKGKNHADFGVTIVKDYYYKVGIRIEKETGSISFTEPIIIARLDRYVPENELINWW